jgi:hypothetical protein
MATFDETRQHVTDLEGVVMSIAAGLDPIAAQIQTLKDQVAAGGVVSQEQLDALDGQVQGIRSSADSTLAREGTM